MTLRGVALAVYARVLRRTVLTGAAPRHVAGNLDLWPSSTAQALKAAREATLGRATRGHLTVAIGYDGRHEIVEGRSWAQR